MNRVHLCVVSSIFLISASSVVAKQANHTRQTEVAQRGKHVMPFDLDLTQHVFAKNENGGVQQVRVKNKADLSQISLIRQHLQKIAAEFKQGNYTDPVTIHGRQMPGLDVLQQLSQDDVSIIYRQLDDGAEITYSSQQPRVIEAIHAWFDAQLSDHGRHASHH